MTSSELKRKIKFINIQGRHTKFLFPKSFNLFNSKDFVFNTYIYKMYILENITRNFRKSRFVMERRRP